MNKLHKSTVGFTIVEILVCMVIAGVVIDSLSRIVISYVALSKSSQYVNVSNAFAEAEVEELRNNGYNSLPIGTTSLTSQLSSQLPRSKSASMVVSSPQTGLKQVDISISYTDQGKTRLSKYTTYVGELGVGQ